MRGEVINGQLITVDTESDELVMIDGSRNAMTYRDISSDVELPYGYDWEDLLGNNVDAVVVDGVVQRIIYSEQE